MSGGARDWLVTTARASAWVRTRDGIVVDAAPIYRRRWMGRPFADLRAAALRCDDITDDQMDPEDETETL